MPRRFLAAAVLVAVLTPATARAQAVLLRLNPPAGQVSTYAFDMDMTMNMAGMGEMNMQTTMRMTQTITAVEADIHTMEMVIDSMSMSGGPGMPAGAGAQMEGVTMTVRMDSRGRQLGMEMPQQLGGAMPGLGGGMPRSFAQVMLPEQPVAPGAEWVDSLPMDLSEEGVGMRVEKNLRYRLEGLERVAGARHARIAVAGTMTFGGGAGPGPVMTGTGDVAGTMVLDLDRGRFVSYGMEMDMLMEMPGMAAPTGMSMVMKGSLVPGA